MSGKRFLVLVLAGILVAGQGAEGNLVNDPGFEGAGGGVWNPYSSHAEFQADFDYAQSFTNLFDGSQSLAVLWTNSVPQWNVFVAEQSFAVTEGYDWSASVYAKAAAPLNGAEMYLETIFYDGLSAEVGKMKSVSLTDYTEWTQLQNSGVISNGAVSANFRLVVFTSGGDSGSGAAFFDAASATATIPEPTTIALFGVAVAALTISRRKTRGI